MAPISGPAYIIIGVLVAAGSWILGSRQDLTKFSLFIVVGVGFIIVGVFKLIMKKGSPKHPTHKAHRTVHHPAHVPPHHAAAHQHSNQAHHHTAQHTQQHYKYCTNCGFRASMVDNFCRRCGARMI